MLTRLGEKVAETSGAPPVYLIEEGDPQAAIRKAVGDDPDIKILILAAGANGRGPGPLISAVLKQGAAFTGRAPRQVEEYLSDIIEPLLERNRGDIARAGELKV